MDLTSLYRMVSAEAPSVPEQMMRGAANQAALQQADEQLMANRRLRELYERGNPSIQELGAISPEYAQKVQQFNNEQLMQQMKMLEMQQNMQKTQNEETEKKQHIFGNVLGVYTEDWLEKHPNPTPQELDEYKHGLGEQLAFIEKAYGHKLDMPLDAHHPEKILTTAEGVMKYNSRRQKTAQEMQLRGLPPQMSSEQYYGGVEMGPYGPKIKPPLPQMGGTAPRATSNIPAPSIEFEGSTYSGPEFARAIMAEQDPARRAKMNEYIDASIVSQKSGIPGSQFVAPQDETRLRVEEKSREAGAVKTSQIEAEEAAADKKALDTYFRGHPPEEIRNIISQSLEGDIQTGIARLGKVFGVSVEGSTPTAALKVITQQMIANSPYPPGSQSNVEYEARLQKIGNPASDEPIKDRLAAINEVYRDQEAFVAQKYKPESVEDILDKRQQGYISEDTARKLYKKLKSKSGKL